MSSCVHTIRARQEDITEYQRSMACLTRLMDQWQSVNQQYGQSEPLKVEQILQRYQEMLQYGRNLGRHSANAFAGLTEQVPGMIDFVRQDIQQMQEAMIEAHAQARQSQRRQQENAAVLLNVLQQRMPEQQEVIHQLSELVEKGDTAEATQLMHRAMQLIGQQTTTLTEQQQVLLQKLQQPESASTPSMWSAESDDNTHSPDRRLQRIDRHIAELAVLDPQQDIAAFIQRAAALSLMPQDRQWDTLSDSLILDLAQVTRTAKALVEQQQELSLLIAGLSSFESSETVELIEQLSQVLASRQLPLMSEAIAQAKAATQQQQQQMAALARREAVLEGLAKLGYEVHEQMAGSWLNQGKVVIRKPATPGYGLELGGASESERFQIRAVALAEQRDVSRDTDIESLWCSEHQALQRILAESGNELTIDRALPAGATPLKVVVQADESASMQTSVRHGRERKL
ncbi:hypothetical protein SOASR032_23040 [Pragia fontium]|uniref:Uncharacterized protein n=1 Tax=Pragia fontium TaxID=82985 RepID=A0ABQ5LJC8_9GAMM|nr:hypothetical protein [Pragia fontium]GKX63735.1 hypothetical protein SOASR032_23040 [Pragia fontium]